jgi:hypothetical protein
VSRPAFAIIGVSVGAILSRTASSIDPQLQIVGDKSSFTARVAS